MSVPGVGQGDMLYQNGSGLWVVVSGTKAEGKIQADGSVAWDDDSGGGGVTHRLLDTIVISSPTINLDFTSISQDYDDLLVLLVDCVTTEGADQDLPHLQLGDNSSVDTGSNYPWKGEYGGKSNGGGDPTSASSIPSGTNGSVVAGRW